MGKYARMRLRYLKEHQPALYRSLLFSGKLHEHLSEIETSAQAMMENIVGKLKEKQGITETIKAIDQMRWVAEMESIQANAEEAVMNDLIYQ